MSTNAKFLNAHDSIVTRNLQKKTTTLNAKRSNFSTLNIKSTSKNSTKNNIIRNKTLKTNNENDKNTDNLTKRGKIDSNITLSSITESLKNTVFETEPVEEVELDLNNKTESLNLENLNTNINLKTTNTFSKDEYREMFTKYVRDDYSSSIISSLLNDEQLNENFLVHHKITERMRTRMVDWMIEVLSNYHCDESTFFEAVNIMDRYFKVCEEKKQLLQPAELHLIGVTSMFIASKYQDIYPLRLKIVQDKIAHRKLTCDEIKDKEDEIMRYISYSIGIPTQWDFINHYLEEIFFINCNKHQIESETLLNNYYENEESSQDKELAGKINPLYTKNMLNLLKHVCVYLAKMNCHDYNLMQKKPSLLAASTIFVAIKICEQINKEDYINEYFTERLNEISQKTENDIIKMAQKILYNAQNFDTLFNGLENLKKVHFNAIIELKVTK